MKFLLLTEIVKSLIRNFAFLLLLLGTVAVCCFIVTITAETREETTEINRLRNEADKLDGEWRNLLLEKEALSEHFRVSSIAKEKLGMYRPSPLSEQIIDISDGADDGAQQEQ